MLEQLTIRNVAVIDRLDVSLSGGMSVLTGETGAGKSIIIDSINLILGSRASKELIRTGAEFAQVQAVFSMTDSVRRALADNDIDAEDGSAIITRRITREGKSSARINGTLVPLNMLRDIAHMLINIHGQHDNQALLDPSRHIEFLDSYADTAKLSEEYGALYSRARSILAEIRSLTASEQERLRKTDILSYQVNEITAAALISGEDEELEAQQRILENAETINENAALAYMKLYGSDNGVSAYDMLSEAVEAVREIARISHEPAAILEELSSAMYAIEDAAGEIRAFGESVELDERAMADVTDRIDLINRLKRKYGSSIDEINAFCENAKQELAALNAGDERAEGLKKELAAVKDELKDAAQRLTERRTAAAHTLEREIEKALGELNMERARFSIRISPKKYASNGADEVEFVIATNPGEELKPLVKIASGGELSRVMLAIKSILAESDGVGTMIFDEIDTGVSGSAAQRIADKLKMIGSGKQVICITHLPQIAGAADNHFLIEKDIDGGLASTKLIPLDHDGRVAELARIVGGGTAAEEYARDILDK